MPAGSRRTELNLNATCSEWRANGRRAILMATVRQDGAQRLLTCQSQSQKSRDTSSTRSPVSILEKFAQVNYKYLLKYLHGTSTFVGKQPSHNELARYRCDRRRLAPSYITRCRGACGSGPRYLGCPRTVPHNVGECRPFATARRCAHSGLAASLTPGRRSHPRGRVSTALVSHLRSE